MGPLGKIAAFFSSNTSLHSGGPTSKELKKAANAAQLAIKRRNRRNEWAYGEAGVPVEERRAVLAELASLGGSSEDVHAIRTKFSRKNPVWSSLRDLRSGRRHAQSVHSVHADVPRTKPPPEATPCRRASEAPPPEAPATRRASEAPPSEAPQTIRASEAPPPEVLPSRNASEAPPPVAPPFRRASEAPQAEVEKPVNGTRPANGFSTANAPSVESPPSAASAASRVPVQEPVPIRVPTDGQEEVHSAEEEEVSPSRCEDQSEGLAPRLARSPSLDLKHRRPTSPPHHQHSDDHNGRLEPVAKQQNGVAAPLPARRTTLTASLRAGATPPGASPPNATPHSPSPQEVAAEVRKRLLPELRHNAVAVEAMAVLLDYTTNKLGGLAAPALRRDLQKMKADMANTVVQLEEARAQYCRLEERRAAEQSEQEEQARSAQEREQERERCMAELQRRLAEHDEEVHTMRVAHDGEVAALRGQLDARALETADAVAVATRGLREEYELELDRVTRRHEETLRAALGAARVDAERDAAQRTQEASRREAEVAAQLRATEAAHEALREQSRRVMDSMKSDKDARTQALAARCRELQDEVDSLRSVLELRCDELQKSRRENDALRIAADQLPGAEQRISTLTARLEDLQVQLDRKGELENKLVMENRELEQSFSKETKEKQMLSLQNEQLQFKLKQNTEVVNALAANMSDFHDVSAILNASVVNGVNISQDKGRRKTINNNNKGSASPPESPRIKGVVEKSESVSYMLEMEADSTDDVVARIYRRMASTPLASPAHRPHHQDAHPRSAPPSTRRVNPMVQALQQQQQQACPLVQSASATTIPTSSRPTPKQRTTSSSASSRVRSRSISSDSGECLSSGNWSPPSSLLSPRQQQVQQQQQVQHRHPDVSEEGLLVPTSGLGYDCSDIEDFSSSKSSSMSCSSEGSELSGPKERPDGVEEEEDEEDGQQLFAQQHQDLMSTSCGSNSELLLVKQMTLPKDAGGEAMICSEEMMTEDDAAANGLNSSCEEDASCSDEEDSRGHRGAAGAGQGRGRAGIAGLPRLALSPMTPTAGCGQSAINTPMDSSWSEDMELPVSLSET